MTPLTLGMFVMIAVGAAGLGGSIYLFVRSNGPTRRPALLGGLGMLVLGVGTFGPSFMDPYGKFLAPLLAGGGEGGSDSDWQKFFDAVAEGKVDDKTAEIGLALAQDSPRPEMQEQIKIALQKAKDPGARKRLDVALRGLNAHARLAEDAINRAKSTAPGGAESLDVSKLPPASAKLAEEKLRRAPADEIKSLKMDTLTADRVSALRAGTARPRGG